MIFHGLFGNIQLSCYLLVGKAATNHSNQLLLAPRKAEILFQNKTRRLVNLAGNVLEQGQAKIGRANSFLIGYGTHGCSNFHRRGILKHISDDSVPHGPKKWSTTTLRSPVFGSTAVKVIGVEAALRLTSGAVVT